MFYEAGVDLIIAGHVHSMERTFPVFNNSINPCGAIHLNLGEGGNYEGAYVPWFNLTTTSDKINHSKEIKSFLFNAPWSAFRESSFGVAEIVFESSTKFNYSWHRHACDISSTNNSNNAMDHISFSDDCISEGDNSNQRMLTSDFIIMEKPLSTVCPNLYKSSPHLTK